MSAYIIQGSDGRFYGPADEAAIDAWASEGRILADTVLIEQGTNRRLVARDIPRLHHHFKYAPAPGTVQSSHQPYTPQSKYHNPLPFIADPRQIQAPIGYARKRKATAAILAFFLGFIGAHRFYLGYSTTGIWMLAITVVGYYMCTWGPVITMVWATLDLVSILTGQMKDANGFALD